MQEESKLYEYFLELVVCFVVYMQKSSGVFCMNYEYFSLFLPHSIEIILF